MVVQQLDSSDEMFHVIYQRLTKRELEVLALVLAGETNRKIAHELNISSHTVKSHVKNIFNKLTHHYPRYSKSNLFSILSTLL